MILINDFSLSSFGTFKIETLEALKNAKYNDLEDMVYRMQLTYDEVFDRLDINYTAESSPGYTLPGGIYELSDIRLMLKSLLPDEVKVNIPIGDIRLRSNLTTNETMKFTGKSLFIPY